MTPYLLELLKELRNQEGFALQDMEMYVGLRQSNISRIETGQHGYFAFVDRFVTAYADACGLEPLDVWRQALERAEEAERLGVEKARKRHRRAVRRAST